MYRWLHSGYMTPKNKKGLLLFFEQKTLIFIGGEGGIRTHGDVATTPDFESGTFDHSATSPAFTIAAGHCRKFYQRSNFT